MRRKAGEKKIKDKSKYSLEMVNFSFFTLNNTKISHFKVFLEEKHKIFTNIYIYIYVCGGVFLVQFCLVCFNAISTIVGFFPFNSYISNI